MFNVFVGILVLASSMMGQDDRLEELFRKLLSKHDDRTADQVAQAKDGLYSVYAEAFLAPNAGDQIRLFTQFINMNPDLGLPQAYLQRGISYGQARRLDPALADFAKATELGMGNSPDLFLNRGIVYLGNRNFEKAIEDLSKSIKLDAGYHLAFHTRGIAYLKSNKNKEAVKDFEQSIKRNKSFDESYIMRGFAYSNLKEYKKAVKDWERAIKLDKKNKKELGSLIKRMKQEQQEQEEAKKRR